MQAVHYGGGISSVGRGLCIMDQSHHQYGGGRDFICTVDGVQYRSAKTVQKQFAGGCIYLLE